MALILAIEPDRRQASQLTAMVRGRLHAELVLAESADRALAALGDRVPDLVLTSALLSPKDESALADRLRSLDGKASYVQTLTIPVLATTSGRGGRRSGVLSALRREKSKSAAPEGCDPDVFAEQCKEYLERAAHERAVMLERPARTTIKEPIRPFSPSPVTGAEWVVVQDEPVAAETAAETPTDAKPEDEPPAAHEPPRDEKAPLYVPPEYRIESDDGIEKYGSAEVDSDAPSASLAVRSTAADDETADPSAGPAEDAEPIAEPLETPPRVDRVLREFLEFTGGDSEGPASLLAAVAALEAEEQASMSVIAPTPLAEPLGSEPVAQISERSEDGSPPQEDGQPEFLDLSSLLQSASPAAASTPLLPSNSDDDGGGDVYEIDAAALLPSRATPDEAERRSNGEPLATLSDLEAIFRDAPEFAAAEARPAPVTPVLDDLKEWEDIVEALRRDAERLETRRPPASTGPGFASAEPAIQPAAVHRAAGEAAAAPATPAETATLTSTATPADTPTLAGTSAPDPAASKRRRKHAKTAPPQDEWGFFDPDQCGFAALIEKLEEVADKDDKAAPRGA
jgi:hypothetical protein